MGEKCPRGGKTHRTGAPAERDGRPQGWGRRERSPRTTQGASGAKERGSQDPSHDGSGEGHGQADQATADATRLRRRGERMRLKWGERLKGGGETTQRRRGRCGTPRRGEGRRKQRKKRGCPRAVRRGQGPPHWRVCPWAEQRKGRGEARGGRQGEGRRAAPGFGAHAECACCRRGPRTGSSLLAWRRRSRSDAGRPSQSTPRPLTGPPSTRAWSSTRGGSNRSTPQGGSHCHHHVWRRLKRRRKRKGSEACAEAPRSPS